MTNPVDITGFSWNGTPIAPAPQQQAVQLPPRQVDADFARAIQESLETLNSPRRMELTEEKEPEVEASKEDQVFNRFADAIEAEDTEAIEEIGLDLGDLGPMSPGAADKLKKMQFDILSRVAKDGTDKGANLIRALIQFSPIPFDTKCLKRAMEIASHFDNLDLITDGCLQTLEARSEELMTRGIVEILESLKHEIISEEIQEAAIYHSLCAGVSTQLEETDTDVLTPILDAISEFKISVQIDALKEAIEELNPDAEVLVKLLKKLKMQASTGVTHDDKRRRVGNR